MDAQDDWLDEPPSRRYQQDSSMSPPEFDDPSAPHYNWVQVCLISAMGLAVGVMGTAAYVIWFNHDQDAYSDAVQSAQRPPTATAVVAGADAAEPPAALATSAVTGRVTPAVPAASTGPLNKPARADDTAALSANETLDEADSSDPADPADVADEAKPAAARPALATNANLNARAERKPFVHHAVKAKPKENFFSRFKSMFRKVDWHRGRDTGKQPDPYSHP
jgi:hypothetical protein